MESVLGRYRNLVILVGVLFLQVLGLAMQVKRAAATMPENTRLIRIWASAPSLPSSAFWSGRRTAPAISGTTIFICAACAPKTAN